MFSSPTHPWKARFGVGMIMLILAFIGLMLTNITKDKSWTYWQWMAPVYGILALWLSWYLRRKEAVSSKVKLWHEVLHWIGLNLSVFLVSQFVSLGIMSRLLASLNVLSLLTLSLFLAGVYIEVSFIPLAIALALFSWGVAFMQQYLYLLLTIVGLIAAIFSFWITRRHPKNQSERLE